MEGPIARRIGREIEGDHAPRRHGHRVLARMESFVRVDDLEEVAMKVNGMRHHRIVDEFDPDALIETKRDRLRDLAQLLAVERPHEAAHVAGEVNPFRARGFARVRIGGQRRKIGIGEDFVTRILEALPRVTETRHCHGRDHFHARAHLDLRRVFRIAHGHVHAAHIHAGRAHAHVRHGGERTLAQRRDRGRHARSRRERGAPEPRAVNRFGDQRESGIVRWLDDHVIGFRGADLEFVDRDRTHILSVGLHNRHLQTGNPHVEDRHGGRVDEPQADAFARAEQGGPVVLRSAAVDQKGVS